MSLDLSWNLAGSLFVFIFFSTWYSCFWLEHFSEDIGKVFLEVMTFKYSYLWPTGCWGGNYVWCHCDAKHMLLSNSGVESYCSSPEALVFVLIFLQMCAEQFCFVCLFVLCPAPHSMHSQHCLDADSSLIYFSMIIISFLEYLFPFKCLLPYFKRYICQPLNQTEEWVPDLCPWCWNLFDWVLNFRRLLTSLLHAENNFFLYHIVFVYFSSDFFK